MTTAIKIEGLSKKYVIGHQKQEHYTALRDVMMHKMRGIGQRLRHPLLPNREEINVEEFWALKDINLEIEQGDRVGIIGRNGAGKSTLLKVLSRITEPTSGKIHLNGRVASLLEVGTGFHPELTGKENIYLNGAILGMHRAEIKRKFDEIVDFSGVEKFLDTPVKRYSSGMYVRLAFAVAAHLEPEILVVDEVLAVGDAQFQKKCLGKMEDVGKEGRTVLFVSHNMGAITTLCEKCVLLHQGSLEAYDVTSSVIALYNRVGQLVQTRPVTQDMRNRGNHAVEFTTCSIGGIDGEGKNTFLIGEDIRIEFEFESRYTGDMSFWLIIFDATGRPLLSTHQRDKEMCHIQKGYHKIVYQTQNLGLMPGNYTISAGAFTPELEFMEWVDHCQAFEVSPCFENGRAFDCRWGDVNQQATWELLPQ